MSLAASIVLSRPNLSPNEEAGPPTFVLLVPPEPSPGLKRTPIEAPGASFPSRRSCSREQALMPTPISRSSDTSDGNSCELFSIDLLIRIFNVEKPGGTHTGFDRRPQDRPRPTSASRAMENSSGAICANQVLIWIERIHDSRKQVAFTWNSTHTHTKGNTDEHMITPIGIA